MTRQPDDNCKVSQLLFKIVEESNLAVAVDTIPGGFQNKTAANDTNSKIWHDSGLSIKMQDEYATYYQKFIHIVEQIKSMRNDHWHLRATTTYTVKFDPPATRPIRYVSCLFGSKAWDDEKDEIDNLLSINVVESAQME